jgi:hypothetical protein
MDINILNFKASKLLKGNLLDTYSPFSGDLSEAVQEIKTDRDEPFTLYPFKAGLLNNVNNKFQAKNDEQAVLRIPIGYSLATKMEADDNIFNYRIYNLINFGLSALVKKHGSLENKQVICERPGQKGIYFTDVQDAAAIELRFFVCNKESNNVSTS